MMRAFCIVMLLGLAPLQCSREPDPTIRREDTAGDALFALSEDFHAKGDEAGRKATLEFLVRRYPSNRHAAAAREVLGPNAPPPDASATPKP